MAALELIKCLEVFLVLIKFSSRSCCTVKFSNDKIIIFSEWPKTNIFNKLFSPATLASQVLYREVKIHRFF